MEDKIRKAIQDLANNVGRDAANELTDYVESAKLPDLGKLIERVAKYKGYAIASTSADDVEKWAREAEIVLTTIEHKLVQEKIVADATVAAFVKRAIAAVGATFGTILRETLSHLTQGLLDGALDTLKEVVGGDDAPKS